MKEAFHMFSPGLQSDKLPTARMKWVLIGLGALPALRIYYVREMVAALMIFSLLFVAGAIVVLVLFLLDLASQRLISWAEGGVLRAAGSAVKAWRIPVAKGASVGQFTTISARRAQASKALQEPTR
jgi:hypothetical protein